jgi:hypothetical protein
MAEPITGLTPDAAIRDANAAIAAVRKIKPKNADEERSKSIELLRLNETLINASRQVVTDAIAKRSNGTSNKSSNGKAAPGKEVLTMRHWNLLPKLIGHALADTVQLVRKEDIAPLIARISELEARPTMKYCGVFDLQQNYKVGDFVTDDGSLWHCCSPTCGVRPGSMPEIWQLAVKRGRDARGR